MTSLYERFLWNFYIVDRNYTTFENAEDVPHFIDQMVPIFLVMIICEILIEQYQNGRKRIKFNDGITSLSLGMIMDISALFAGGFELIGYQWLYQFRFLDFDWKSPLTWWVAAFGVDFVYYWIHRSAHEISIIWCWHQVHHSSEEYKLTSAVRQPVFHHLFTIGYHQPLALLGIPLPALLVHLKLNLFFQFWIHSSLISNLGPLEWIFNTASHHRVHHGINKWCLDKNYAGFLIIWDRMFGTFQKERQDEKIVYGLVIQPQTFNPFYLQMFYFIDVIKKARSMTSWKDSLKTLFYGPGWTPGSIRLGDENAIPEKTPERDKYCPKTTIWVDCYLVAHFLITLLVQQKFMTTYASFNWFTALIFLMIVFSSLFTIGSLFDGRWWASVLEGARCVAIFLLLNYGIVAFTNITVVNFFISGYFAMSSFIWLGYFIYAVNMEKMKSL